MHGRRSRRLLALAAALTALAALPPTASAASSPSRTAAKPARPTALLFVQETDGGRIARVGRGRYRLVLSGVSRAVETFTDRPSRRAGQEPIGAYVARWAARGFASDPPNAALVVHDAPRSSDVAMLTLSHPRYDRRAGTLSYDARPLRGDAGGGLAGFGRRADRVRERTFSAASLFVDDAGAETLYQQVQLEVSNAVPGQQIAVMLSPAGSSPISWSTGPPFQDAFGIQVEAQSGQLPLAQLNIDAQQATFMTTSSGGGGGSSLTFSVSLYLVAQGDVEVFYLKSASDPGVLITAAIGNEQPQLVNQTDTLFSWFAD